MFWRPQNAHFCTYMTKSEGGGTICISVPAPNSGGTCPPCTPRDLRLCSTNDTTMLLNRWNLWLGPWHIFLWVCTGWFLAASGRAPGTSRRPRSVASISEVVQPFRHRRRHTCSDCRSNPDTPAPTPPHYIESRPPNSDSNIPPTPGCNTATLTLHKYCTFGVENGF